MDPIISSIVLDPSKSKVVANFVKDQMKRYKEQLQDNVILDDPIFETNNFSRGLFDEPKEFYLSDKQINMQINKRFLSELPGYDTIYDKTPEKVINYGPALNKLFSPAKKQKIEA